MKNRRYSMRAALLLFVLLAFCLSGCAKTVTISVKDASSVTEIETKTGKTVKAILEEAGIALAEKDQTNPPLDEEITELTSEITILRYAKVSIVKKGKKTEVELNGGTVTDALKKAGITLEEGEDTSPKGETPVKDQMTIIIAKEIEVSLTADGSTKKLSTRASDVQSFLEEANVTLSKEDEVSEKLDTALTDGMKITVKRITYKEVTEKESIDFDTKTEYSSSMYQGQSQVKQEGVKGEKEVVYKVKYADSKEVSREALSEKVLKEPVDQVLVAGTKEQTTTPKKSEVSRVKYPTCGDPSHGYYEITYSDGSVEYVEY
ncbi:MAG: G5 domain-containing protein [Clostridia bacterium]|nr:G5 domain-containing protein [Clostridia bacterium]